MKEHLLTENEKKVLEILTGNPKTSLRTLVKILSLGGVASASWIINSLEKHGYVQRVGINTHKEYRVIKGQRSNITEYYDENFNRITPPEWSLRFNGSN